MKIVKISNLNNYIGYKVMRNIYIGDGIAYLSSGSILTEEYVRTLQKKKDKLPFEFVYLDTPDSKEIECYQDVLSDELKFKAKKELNEIFNRVSVINPGAIKSTVEEIIDELRANKHVNYGIGTLLFAGGQDHAAHCFNVSVLASIIGIKAGLPINSVKEIALGAALHDIGKAKINKKLIDMRYKYQSKEDFIEMQRHPIEGYNLVKNQNISTLAKRIILMHHVWKDHEESYNSYFDIYNSYPMKVNGKRIDPVYKDLTIEIVQVSDVFEAMTNHDRLYKTRKPKSHALEYIRSMEVAQFGEGARLFLTYISPFSVGAEVILNNGEKAIVIKQSSIPERPVIKCLSGDREGRIINLVERENLTLAIVDEV